MPSSALGGGHVEHVVDDLERHAIRLPELGERLDLISRSPPTIAPMRQAVANSDAVLPSMAEKYAASLAVHVVGRPQLADLALAQPADRRRQQPGHLGPERCGDLRRPGQQEVAGEDGGQVPPAGVDALDGAPGGGLVDDVVVVQRAEVDELDGDPTLHDLVIHRRAPGGRGGDREEGPDPLAASQDQVARDLGEVRVVGSYDVAQGLSTRERQISTQPRLEQGSRMATTDTRH